jgi:hypothetical protein
MYNIYMDTRLKQALDLSTSLEMLANQKALAFSKYKQTQILYYSGGTFVADLSLLNAVSILKTIEVEHILVDSNNIPVLISDIEEFYFLIQSRIIETNRQYYTDFEELKKTRTPQRLLEK